LFCYCWFIFCALSLPSSSVQAVTGRWGWLYKSNTMFF